MRALRFVRVGVVLFAALVPLSPVAIARAQTGPQSPAPPPGLPDFQPALQQAEAVSLTCAGSSSIERLVRRWALLFRELQPNVDVELETKGTATAVPTLTGRKAQIGLIARSMRASEATAFADRRGYKPTAVPVALEAVAVAVHPDNPLPGLTLEQLDAVFSRSRLRGTERAVELWKELGVTGALANVRIQLLSREAGSATRELFVELALRGAEVRPEAVELASPDDLVQRLARSPAAIGFAGLASLSAAVRAVPLGTHAGGLVLPDEHSVRAGSYPLTRTFTAVVDRPPGHPTEPVVREFLRFALSRQGQAAAVEFGFIPLSAEEARKALRVLD